MAPGHISGFVPPSPTRHGWIGVPLAILLSVLALSLATWRTAGRYTAVDAFARADAVDTRLDEADAREAALLRRIVMLEAAVTGQSSRMDVCCSGGAC
jgi:hypothetical protein